MKKKFLNLTEKFHLIIYQLVIAFALFFYGALKGATGHKFIITNEEKIYYFISFSVVILSILYSKSERFNQKLKKSILYVFLTLTLVTLFISVYFLYFTFTFNYGFDESAIFIIMIFFLLPIIFTWCNFYLIKDIIKNLRE